MPSFKPPSVTALIVGYWCHLSSSSSIFCDIWNWTITIFLYSSRCLIDSAGVLTSITAGAGISPGRTIIFVEDSMHDHGNLPVGSLELLPNFRYLFFVPGMLKCLVHLLFLNLYNILFPDISYLWHLYGVRTHFPNGSMSHLSLCWRSRKAFLHIFMLVFPVYFD